MALCEVIDNNEYFYVRFLQSIIQKHVSERIMAWLSHYIIFFANRPQFIVTIQRPVGLF